MTSWDDEDPKERPAEVGWCHNCGTLQLYRDAPWLTWLGPGTKPEPCCVVCREEEPWGLAVWDAPENLRLCAQRRHVTHGEGCDECGRIAPGWR